jgi:hypothetical protein
LDCLCLNLSPGIFLGFLEFSEYFSCFKTFSRISWKCFRIENLIQKMKKTLSFIWAHLWKSAFAPPTPSAPRYHPDPCELLSPNIEVRSRPLNSFPWHMVTFGPALAQPSSARLVSMADMAMAPPLPVFLACAPRGPRIPRP